MVNIATWVICDKKLRGISDLIGHVMTQGTLSIGKVAKIMSHTKLFSILILSVTSKYIFDFKGIKHKESLEATLKNKWGDFISHSDRCYEVSGEPWERIDVIRLWQSIGSGHIALFSYNDEETCYELDYFRPKGRREELKSKLRIDLDLDALTLQFL